MSTELTVLYADDALLVLEKPSGVLSVPGRGADKQDCLSLRAQRVYPDALVVHRLDMATSGLLLMARGIAMQRALSAAFAERQVAKCYVADVAGLLAPGAPWQLIDLPIAPDWPRRPLRIVHPQGQPSQTLWRCISQDLQRQASRLELQPLTGRSHQLRLHLQALGHPILGDALYAPAPVQAMAARLHLHARDLTLAHPRTGQSLQWHCPAPF